MGGNICGISAWRLTRCIYAQRESSIHHGVVILRLSGLLGRRGTRRKISGLGQVSVFLPTSLPPRSWTSVSRQRYRVLTQERDPPPPLHRRESKDRVIVPVMPLTGSVSLGEAWLIAGPRLSCEMGRLRISAFKVGSAMIQNLRGGG